VTPDKFECIGRVTGKVSTTGASTPFLLIILDAPSRPRNRATTEVRLATVPGKEAAAAEDEDLDAGLEFGELAAFGGVVGKLVIGERGAWDDECTWDFLRAAQTSYAGLFAGTLHGAFRFPNWQF